jgi:formylglycine-generating enzyme required for sulfatase activity
MVYVPSGNFLMGSGDTDPEAYFNELPAHTVYVAAFWIDRTEVTNAQYAKCVDAGACPPPCDWEDDEYNSNDQLVVCVDWHKAQAYCDWSSARLPTEAEWEKAAQGTDGRIYPWGDEKPDCTKANNSGCLGHTSPVGSYPAGSSPDGALDMAGNAYEWVSDWYDGAYYAVSPVTNPQGPASGQERVRRGGSYLSDPELVRSALRTGQSPDYAYLNYGFRCAFTPKPTP